jgi:hypothetical protein
MLCIKKNKCFVLRKINAFQLCCYYRKNRQHTSPLVIRSDLLKHVQTCWNTFQSVQICRNTFRPVETRSDLLKHVQTCWNTFQSVQINPFKPVETRWNTFQSVQICRNTFTPVETRFPPSPSSLGLNILIIMYLVFNCVFIVFNEIIQKHLETFLLCPC